MPMPYPGRFHEGPHRRRREGHHRPMDRLRPIGRDLREPGTHTVGQKGKQFPRTPSRRDEPERMAQGNAPSCQEPAGLSR